MLRTRKFISLICVCGMLISCTACSGKPEEVRQKKVSVICKSTDPYWNAVKTAVKDAEAEFGDMEVSYSSPETEDVQEQKKLIEQAISEKTDLIVIAPVSDTELNDTLSLAVTNGIPVITIDSDVTFAGRIMCLSTQNESAAEIAGRYVSEQAEKNSVVAVMTHDMDSPTAQQRTEGFLNAFETEYGDTPYYNAFRPVEESGIQFLESVDCKGDISQSEETAINLLLENEDIDYIYTTNQPTTIGACQAVKKLDLTGTRHGVQVVGFDFFDGAEEYIESGILSGVVVQVSWYQICRCCIKRRTSTRFA